MPDKIIEKSPAKINLFLKIINRRDDGYHNIRTGITFVDLHDEITVQPHNKFEVIYTGKLNKKSKDFDYIINISEDGWFGNSIGPEQHFSHSIFRAIEEGKNLYRSSNNGISAHINPVGKIENKIKSTQSGVIEVKNVKFIKETIFSKQGNKIFFYFLLIYITFAFFLKRKDL